jgi:hypothetical protein
MEGLARSYIETWSQISTIAAALVVLKELQLFDRLIVTAQGQALKYSVSRLP